MQTSEGGVFGIADVCGQGGREGSKIGQILRTSFMDGPYINIMYIYFFSLISKYFRFTYPKEGSE